MTTPTLTLPPAVTDLDETALPVELWAEHCQQLLDAGNRARLAEERIGKMETAFYRLLFAGEQLLAGRLTMDGFSVVVRETRKK